MSDEKRIKLAAPLGTQLSVSQQLVLDNLIEYGSISQKEAEKDGISKRPLLPIVQSLCALGHPIYMEVSIDEMGEDIEPSRTFYFDDCSFVTERTLGMPSAVSFPKPNIDFPE